MRQCGFLGDQARGFVETSLMICDIDESRPTPEKVSEEAHIMFQVIYEYQGTWPEEGKMKVKGQFMEKSFSRVIEVSPTKAKRHANNYLSRDVATGIYADDPILTMGETPRWRLALSLRLPSLETTEIPGSIEIDALTGNVITLSSDKLKLILDMANDIAKRLTLAAAPAS